jgi:hypothetical protein
MRVIYLTLAIFIMLGIGAACRTPGLSPADCPQDISDPALCPGAPR